MEELDDDHEVDAEVGPAAAAGLARSVGLRSQEGIESDVSEVSDQERVTDLIAESKQSAEDSALAKEEDAVEPIAAQPNQLIPFFSRRSMNQVHHSGMDVAFHKLPFHREKLINRNE